MDLSIIIPYAGEYPQILWTVASIHEDLHDRGIEYEIITVNNDCSRWRTQLASNPGLFQGQIQVDKRTGIGIPKSEEALEAAARVNPWLKNLAHTGGLSHWQCKNVGLKASSGTFIWFCDAHCLVPRGALWGLFQHYREHHQVLNGSLHFANTYKLLEEKPQAYRLVDELDKGYIGYSLTPFAEFGAGFEAIEVPCASSCGMMATRKLIHDLGGGFPQKFSYGGGENFWNFVLATLGGKKWLYTRHFLRHQGMPRDYQYTWEGLVWNRCAAMYLIGGRELAERFIDHRKGRKKVLWDILTDVLTSCDFQRAVIKKKQVVDIHEWADRWKRVDKAA